MTEKLLSIELLMKLTTSPDSPNLRSIHAGLRTCGTMAGLNPPHRLVAYLAQLSHESMGFKYDRELWGPTPAQARYDTRTDLGNTAAVDGDGYKFRGHTGIQITGRRNTEMFRNWCWKNVATQEAPDFLQFPELMNTDPWEGLGPIWYWHTNDLNAYADRGDFEGLTKRINGGTNGYADRQERYTKIALVTLGFAPTDIKGFRQSRIIHGAGLVNSTAMGQLTAALKEMDPFRFQSMVPTIPAAVPKVVPVAVPAAAPTHPFHWATLGQALLAFLRTMKGKS